MSRAKFIIQELEEISRAFNKDLGRPINEMSVVDVYHKAFEVLPKDKFVLGGGLLTHFYSEPRYTKDVDLVVLGNYKELHKKLEDNEFDHMGSTSFFKDSVVVHEYVYGEGENLKHLDLIEIKNKELLDFLINTAKDHKVFDRDGKILSPEGFVLMKFIAGRTKDYADIEAVLEKTKVDMDVVKDWLQKLKIFDRLSKLDLYKE